MGVNASTVWEVRPSTGNDNNGGGFALGISAKDVTASATLAIDSVNNLKVTSSAHNFVAGDVNKYIGVTAGTGWTAGYYKILSVSSNAAILDRAPSAAGNGSLGTYDLYAGIDYTTQGGAQYSASDLAVDAVTNTRVTSASHAFTNNDVGNVMHITSGAPWTAGFYQITSITGSAANLDRSPAAVGSGSGAYAVGGAVATLSSIASAYVASNKIFVLAEATLVQGNVSMNQGATPASATPWTRVMGYSSTRGDGGRATLQLNVGNTSLLTFGNSGLSLENFVLDCNVQTNSQGVNSSSASCRVINCLIKNFTTFGIQSGAGYMTVLNTEITAGSGTAGVKFATTGILFGCNVHDNTCTGVVLSGNPCNVVVTQNLIENNTGGSSHGIDVSGNSVWILNNTITGNGIYGINLSHATGFQIEVILNNILANNGLAGIRCSLGITADVMYDGNAFYNNGAGNRNNMDDLTAVRVNSVAPYTNVNEESLSADPFVNSTINDFSLNNTAGGGAQCQSAAVPVTFPGNSGLSVNFKDMGACQYGKHTIVTEAFQYGLS